MDPTKSKKLDGDAFIYEMAAKAVVHLHSSFSLASSVVSRFEKDHTVERAEQSQPRVRRRRIYIRNDSNKLSAFTYILSNGRSIDDGGRTLSYTLLGAAAPHIVTRTSVG
jgi:hypothetical protein